MVLFSEENRRSAWIKRLQRVLLCLIDGPYACSIASVDRKRRPGDKRRGLGTEIEYCIRCIFRPGFAPQRNTPAHTPDVSGGEHLLNFQFKLKAAYPYWRTVETAATMLGGLEGSWFPTPVSTTGSWYISKYKKDVYTTVVNSGSTETEFVLTLTAAARVKNPMLWHNGKRSYLKLNKEMLPGESAIISTVDGSRGCTYRQSDGTEVNGFRWLDYDSDLWMTLDPGDNVLRLTADEGRENLTATVTAPKGVAAGV